VLVEQHVAQLDVAVRDAPGGVQVHEARQQLLHPPDRLLRRDHGARADALLQQRLQIRGLLRGHHHQRLAALLPAQHAPPRTRAAERAPRAA